MRIVSLLPSATEIVYLLGLQDSLVGVTHECDFPADARAKPVLIESILGADSQRLSAREIDEKIRATVRAGKSVYRFKPGALQEAKPDVILTQGLCDVCAIPHNFVVQEAKGLRPEPQLISLDPLDLAGILTDVRRVGEVTGAIDRAGEVVDGLEERIGEIAGRTRDIPPTRRPRVAILEWTDPVYTAGHWAPEMVELAGGVDVLAKPGEPSHAIEWDAVIKAQPEVLIVAPCGYNKEQAAKAIDALKTRPDWSNLPAVKSDRVHAFDANAHLSRPGPRIVDGLEALARLVQPGLF
jgi:iron complex transport system substrate-binding protein